MEVITEDWNKKVADDDVVLIAGDISWAMNLADALPDLHLLGSLRGNKVFIRGNHDYWWKAIGAVRQSLLQKSYAVQNDCIRIGDLLVCGSRGWATPENVGGVTAEDKKIYDREVQRFILSLEAMQKMRTDGDRVVVMIHFPPCNSRWEQSEFMRLFEKYGVNTVVYGHLHGNPGRVCYDRTVNGVRYLLTSCDLVNNRLVTVF